jgi:hypothetical protein
VPEFTGFLERLRHDLGRGYSVAHQQASAMPGHINVLVRRRGAPDTLCVTLETRWVAALDVESASSRERVEYKHLTMLVQRAFDTPSALPGAAFNWPGTPESRDALRRALDPRQQKRS